MQITREFYPGATRYLWDFQQCHYRDDWAQVDTDQDASYFGQWANPFTLEHVCYCEGDVSRTKCDSPTEFSAEMRRISELYISAGWGFKIDGMCSERIISEFEKIGLSDLLH